MSRRAAYVAEHRLAQHTRNMREVHLSGGNGKVGKVYARSSWLGSIGVMPKRSSEPTDLNRRAAAIVAQSTDPDDPPIQMTKETTPMRGRTLKLK